MSEISILFSLALKVVIVVAVGSKLLRAERMDANSRAMIEVGWGLVGECELKMMENGQ